MMSSKTSLCVSTARLWERRLVPLSLKSIGDEKSVSLTAAKKYLPKRTRTSGNVSLKSEDGSADSRGAMTHGHDLSNRCPTFLVGESRSGSKPNSKKMQISC